MAATSFFIVVVGSKLQIPTFNGLRLLCVNLREHFKSSIVFHSASIILHLDLKSFFYTLLCSNLFEPQSWGRPKLIDHIHLLGQKRQNKCSKSPKINWTLNFQNPEIQSDTLKKHCLIRTLEQIDYFRCRQESWSKWWHASSCSISYDLFHFSAS